MEIDINRTDFYTHESIEHDGRTLERLNQIKNMGMVETGTASFGFKGIVNGLYIEYVWNHTQIEWEDRIGWMQSVKDKKSK